MSSNRHRQAGFTLIELVAVITVLSLAGVGIAVGFSSMGRNQLFNEDLQAAAQLAQACADHIVGVRRNVGYAAATTANCSGLGAFNGYGPPTVTTFVPTSPNPCPTGATCTGFTISVGYGSNGASAQAVLMLTNY